MMWMPSKLIEADAAPNEILEQHISVYEYIQRKRESSIAVYIHIYTENAEREGNGEG